MLLLLLQGMLSENRSKLMCLPALNFWLVFITNYTILVRTLWVFIEEVLYNRVTNQGECI